MEFELLINKRRSVRSYLDSVPEKEKIDKVISAALRAPSAGNLQSYKIAIVGDKMLKQQLYSVCHNQRWVLKSQILLVFIADPSHAAQKYGQRGVELYAIQDATIAAAYAQLEAANLGLGSVWVGSFESEKVSGILNLAKDEIPIAILPIGHAAEEPPLKERRSRADIVLNR